MNFLKAFCLFLALTLALSARADQPQVYNTGAGYYPSYVLATNLSAVPKNSTNTAVPFAPNIASNWTFLSQPVPLPPNARGIDILPTFVPAGNLIGTSNIVVGFEYSDGLTYTTTTDPLTITFAQAVGTNVTASIFINATNFYGNKFLIPDYVSNQGLTNGTLSLNYGFALP